MRDQKPRLASLAAAALLTLASCANVADRDSGSGGTGGTGNAGGTAGSGGAAGAGGTIRTFEEAAGDFCARARECDPDATVFPDCLGLILPLEAELWGACQPTVDAFFSCWETAPCEEFLFPIETDPCIAPFVNDPCLLPLFL